MPTSAILLFEDETIIRLFPGLRRAWSKRGQQAWIPISGRNARRVLFGAVNVKTGHRIIARYNNMQQGSFQNYLRLLRSRYRGRPIWMLLDGASCHNTATSKTLAAALQITLIPLPKQCPELNGMDHMWRALKSDISSNFQYQSIDDHARMAEQYILDMSNRMALRRAGILADNFWLKRVLQNLWQLT